MISPWIDSATIDPPDTGTFLCADCGCEIDYAELCDSCHDLHTVSASCPVESEACDCCGGRGLIGDCECPRCHGTGDMPGFCERMDRAERAQIVKSQFDYEPETAVAA